MAEDLNKFTTPGRNLVKDFTNGPPGLNYRNSTYVDVYVHPTEMQNFIQLVYPAALPLQSQFFARRIVGGRPGPWFSAASLATTETEDG